MRCTRPSFAPLLIALGSLGCEADREPEKIVPMAEVPARALEVARQKLPGIQFNKAWKVSDEGKDAFEIRGVDKVGKIRDIRVTAGGEVLEID